MDDERVSTGLHPIPNNVVWTDNGPTQYKCWQNFLKVATASESLKYKQNIIHKFVYKYRFKGSWDATCKLVKEKIKNLELKYERWNTAWSCYKRLKCLEKNENEKEMRDLLHHEQTYNTKVLDNSTFTTKWTHIGFGTEDREKYDKLVAEGVHSNIVFMDRTNIPDMLPVPDTL